MPGFGITRRSRHGLVVVLMLGFACLSGPAAQEPPRERRDQPDRMKRDGRRDRHPRRPQHGRGRGLGPRELTRFLFRITPEDRVPLRDGLLTEAERELGRIAKECCDGRACFAVIVVY